MLKVTLSPLDYVIRAFYWSRSPAAAARSSEPYSNTSANQQHFCNRIFILWQVVHMSLYRDWKTVQEQHL